LSSRQVQLLVCKPAIWREEFADPTLPNWIKTWGATVECDGDIVKFTKGPTSDYYVLQRLGLNIDSDDYAIVVFRAKKTSNLVGVTGTWVEIFDVLGEWIGGYEFTETDFTIHVFQLPAGKTVTEVRLTFGNAGTIVGSMYVDFILFTKANPFYSTEDLGDVFDIPQCKVGVNDRADFLQLIIDNHNGQHKDRFAYRDEAYLWVKKNGDFNRVFGGYIESIDPESVQYGTEYLTLNALGWSALLYERLSVEAYENEDVDDVVKSIIDEADKQASLGFTTFGVKDVQKKVDILKCDYDTPLSKLVEMCDDLDLCFHVEPNRDASLYPKGKRFLRYAGWMEDSWEKGWACTADSFGTDGDIAQMKTKAEGGTGTLYRVTVISVDSTVFKKLLLELKGSDADTQYSVKVVTEDDVEYTLQALTAAPTSYTVKEWDLTGIITGDNKTVKNVHLLISKSGSQGILYFKWFGFFPTTPPYEKITLDVATNVRAGAFQRDPKKARNMVIVKGDKFPYNVPFDPDEWTKEPAPTIIEEDYPTFWTPGAGASGGTIGTPVVSGDTAEKKVGTQSTKIVVGSGSYKYWWLEHHYASAEDWSLKNYIFLWWYGTNSGKKMCFRIDNVYPNSLEYYFYDNWAGWPAVPIMINIKKPDYAGGDIISILSHVTDIVLGTVEENMGGTFRLDEVVLSIGRFCWGAEHCTLSNNQDSKAGVYALKANFEAGILNDFQRQSSGFILQDPFDTLDLTKYDKGYGGTGDGDSYVEGGELVNKIKSTNASYRRWIVTKDLKSLNGIVVEVKINLAGITLGATSDRFILSTQHMITGTPTDTDHLQVYGFVDWSENKYWEVSERDYPNDPVEHYNSGVSTIVSRVAKIILTETNVKVYLDNVLVCNKTRVLNFTNAYIYLYGSTGVTSYQYPKQDNLKIYKDIKIYVEGLSANWKVELWSGTNASPGSKQAEATVPAGSTIAELNVLTLVFPFTGFFKVYNAGGTLDHTSPDYNDIWGGDRYLAKQTSAAMEHKVIFPKTKDLGINAVELKKLKFWFKHSSGDVAETARLILATDDDNYYYTDFSPVSKWKELFEFDVGWIQNILFENVGTPSLKNLNYVAFLYPATSAVEWVMIDEFRFEGETEAWGIARDEESIADIGLQPEKIFSSYYKTQEDAQKAADYFLSILKNPPLVKGSLTHPWGLPQIRAGEIAIANVPNENINNEEMIVKEVIHVIPPASSKLTTEISLAGVLHALTDPQKRLKEHIERLTKADVYAENVEILAMPLKENLQITDVLTAELETPLADDMSMTDIIEALIEALLTETMTITDDLKVDMETTVSDSMSISDYVEALWEIYVSDSMSISDYLEALIEALLSESMNISDYLMARRIWDEFNALTDWTVTEGTWTADGVAHETDTAVGSKTLEYSGGNNFPNDYFWEILAKALVQATTQVGVRFRWNTGPPVNTYEVWFRPSTDTIEYYKCVNGTWSQVATASRASAIDVFYKLKVDQRDEGTNYRVKVYWENETSPCINNLESPRSTNSGKVRLKVYVGTAGGKADFDYFRMWTE